MKAGFYEESLIDVCLDTPLTKESLSKIIHDITEGKPELRKLMVNDLIDNEDIIGK